jgi:hypothetical protein
VDGSPFDAAGRAAPGEGVTLAVVGTVVAVAALVSVAVEDPGGGPGWPFLFVPDDFRRLGGTPRAGDRWALTLAVDPDGRAIAGVRLVGRAIAGVRLVGLARA